jgi:hypothetical protein
MPDTVNPSVVHPASSFDQFAAIGSISILPSACWPLGAVPHCWTEYIGFLSQPPFQAVSIVVEAIVVNDALQIWNSFVCILGMELWKRNRHFVAFQLAGKRQQKGISTLQFLGMCNGLTRTPKHGDPRTSRTSTLHAAEYVARKFKAFNLRGVLPDTNKIALVAFEESCSPSTMMGGLQSTTVAHSR